MAAKTEKESFLMWSKIDFCMKKVICFVLATRTCGTLIKELIFSCIPSESFLIKLEQHLELKGKVDGKGLYKVNVVSK